MSDTTDLKPDMTGTFASYTLPNGDMVLTARYKDAEGNEGEYKKKIGKTMLKLVTSGGGPFGGFFKMLGNSDE